MRNKKAISSHIDWMISIGIFLIYLLSIFVFVKPGIKETHQPETLLKLLEEKFNEETNWIVKKVPLYLKTCGSLDEGIRMSFPFLSWNRDWILIKDSNEPPNIPDYTITEYELYLKKTTENYLICYTPDEIQGHDPLTCDETSYCTNCDGTAQYGVAETLEGLSETRLDELKDKDYENAAGTGIKQEWNFPDVKEFIITIYQDGNELGEIGYERDPPINIPIYIRQYKTWLLKKDCTREQITINIKIW
jgi:hypothetical protein